MKCNIEGSIKRQISNKITDALNEQILLRDLLDIVILHDVFGFGQKRLEKWGETRDKLYIEFTEESHCTDNPHRKGAKKMTNLDTATLRVLRGLRSHGIDYHTILGIEDLRIDGESMDAIIDRMEQGRTV